MLTRPTVHRPVLLGEIIAGVAPRPGGTYLDGTIGGGGHAAALLKASAPDGRLLGLDRDPNALERARQALVDFAGRFSLAQGSFADLTALAAAAGFTRFDGIVLDLGFSSDQLADPSRGFSFQADGPLDMRLDPATAVTAGDLVNGLDEAELADLIYQYGEERRSRRVARAIVATRPHRTTTGLAAVVAGAIGRRAGRTHPATRTFQALRIAVNDELDTLARGLPLAIDALLPGARLGVISFHSLEDRIVKRTLRDAASDCICPAGLPECRCEHDATMRLVTRRPITAGAPEVSANPRARSARLRIAERLGASEAPPEGGQS